MRRIRPMALPITGVLLAALHCSCVHAEVRVEGDAGAVRVEARDATVGEIFAALSERFALRYRGTPVSAGGINATFEGPLRRVVARVLAGFNYIIADHPDGLEVIVLSTGAPYAVVPPTIAPPTYPSRSTRRNE